MKIIHCDQGSPEWHKARTGCITASMFKVARQRVNGLDAKQSIYVNAILSGKTEGNARELAGYKNKPSAEVVQRALDGETVGEPSEAALNYAFRLAVERISGAPLDEGYETYAMRRGHELEPEARHEHEMQAGVIVMRAGFVTTDDGLFGASADGLIDEDGGSEYKCLISPETMRPVLLNDDISEYTDQIQGCMWITAREWWAYGMYCPAFQPIGKQLYLRNVPRDDNYIEQLETDLLAFERLVSGYQAVLMEKAA